jgi:hypothetical protein
VKTALSAVDPTGPARTETKPAEINPPETPAIESGEDDAVEIAAAKPVSEPASDPKPPQPSSSEPASSDPDVTPAPEALTKEKT